MVYYYYYYTSCSQCTHKKIIMSDVILSLEPGRDLDLIQARWSMSADARKLQSARVLILLHLRQSNPSWVQDQHSYHSATKKILMTELVNCWNCSCSLTVFTSGFRSCVTNLCWRCYLIYLRILLLLYLPVDFAVMVFTCGFCCYSINSIIKLLWG